MKATGEKIIFLEMWNELPNVCCITGEPLLPLNHMHWHSQFSHVLPKGLYKKAKLSKENIKLMLPEHHYNYGNRGRDFLLNSEHADKWLEILDLYDELKQKYHQGYFDSL